VADLTGNGILDLAVADPEGGAIDIFLGNGDGTFYEGQPVAGFFPAEIVSADFNGDGKPDLAVLTGIYISDVALFLGNGDGTFGPEIDFPAGASAVIGPGDFNGDHKIDMAIGDYLGNSVITLLNTGEVAFSPTTPLNFKTQAVGTKSAPQTVILTNNGRAALKISAMKATGQFSMSSTCGSSVAVGARCSINVTFAPTSKGSKFGTVTINDSASSEPMVIELSGTGT
jgi:hypothetical protein